MNFKLNRRQALGLLAYMFGCNSQPPSPPPEMDNSRFQLTEIRLNQDVLGVDSSEPISANKGEVLEFEGSGTVAAGIILSPKAVAPGEPSQPIILGAPLPARKRKAEDKLMDVLFWFVIVKPGSSPLDSSIESSMFRTYPDRKEAAFEGELPAPKSAGSYEVQGYAMWFEPFSPFEKPGGIVEPERHLIFSRPLKVE